MDEFAIRGHELRTPLNTIVGYSELLLEDLDVSDVEGIRADLRRIRDAGRQLIALVDDVVRVQRAEARGTSHREGVDLNTLLRGMLPSLQTLLSADQCRLEWTLAPSVRVMTDPDQVSAIVRSLVHRSTRDGGARRVHLTLEVTDGQARVQVVDDGTRNGEASGMVVAERTAALLGGHLEVRRASEGTSAVLSLPGAAVDGPVTLDAYLESDVPVVLVVDDDANVADLVRRHLARSACQVVHATSGKAALRLARRVRPAVITLDVMMPDMDGWDTLARLRSVPELAGIPVVMMSVLGDGQARGLGLGAAEYLQKPVERTALLETVERFLVHPRSRVLVVDDESSARELARRLLVGAGYLVDEVSDGRQALDYLQSERPDLILLDLLMPEMDGFSVIREIQGQPGLASIPLIVLTAMTLSAEDRERLGTATRAILAKGEPTEQVLQRIVDALESRARD